MESCDTLLLYENWNLISGSEAIQHAINLTQTPAVITSQELLPKLAASLDQLPNVRLVVVFEDTYLDEEYPIPVDMKTLNQNISHNIQIISYKDVVNLGKNSDIGNLEIFFRISLPDSGSYLNTSI